MKFFFALSRPRIFHFVHSLLSHNFISDCTITCLGSRYYFLQSTWWCIWFHRLTSRKYHHHISRTKSLSLNHAREPSDGFAHWCLRWSLLDRLKHSIAEWLLPLIRFHFSNNCTKQISLRKEIHTQVALKSRWETVDYQSQKVPLKTSDIWEDKYRKDKVNSFTYGLIQTYKLSIELLSSVIASRLP